MAQLPSMWNPRTPLTGPYRTTDGPKPEQLASKWFVDAWNSMLQAVEDLMSSELVYVVDSYANRVNLPAADYPVGSTFEASDLGVSFVVRKVLGSNQWVYAFGTGSSVQASLPALILEDAGVLWEVTDYAHVLRWTGAGWEFGPGESGSGMLVDFPFAPTGGVWQSCDGTTVDYLKADGTVANFTTPVVAGQYFRR